MLRFKSSPFEEDIEKATNENNLTDDWALIMLICDKAVNYQDGSKFCFKSILKRLNHNVPRVALQTLTLLDACVKNCDKRFLLQVASNEFIQEARKLLSKMHPSVATKLKELIQKWSFEEFESDPELCIIPAFYYKLKSEGVEFPPTVKEAKQPKVICTDPNAVTSQEEENDIIKAIEISIKDTGRYPVLADGGNQELGHATIEPFKVRALYDFEAAEDNELTISAGEIVMVLDNSNCNWWKGSNHRGEGLFPANFVTKDLSAKPEEPPAVQQETRTLASIDETLETMEVKLDEETIELAIKWLDEADPTGEIPDPDEMILLERECLKMVPLLEERFQTVDNRLACLNLVNKKIMDAFELFHSLSNSGLTSRTSGKLENNYNTSNGAFVQSQVPSTTVTTSHQIIPPTVPTTAFYLPAPTTTSQFIMPNEVIQGRPISAAQMQMPQQSIMVQPSFPRQMVVSQEKHPSSVSSTSSGFVQTQPVPTGMQYAHPFPIPPQAYAAYIQNQSHIQGHQPVPNYMTAGPYIPFPYYYVNGTESSQILSAVQSSAAASMTSITPNTVQGQLPNTVQGQLPNTVQGQLPNTIQRQLPNTVQGQLSNTIQGQLPNTVQRQVPNTGAQDTESTNTAAPTVVTPSYSQDLQKIHIGNMCSQETDTQHPSLSFQAAGSIQSHGTIMTASEQL